MLLARFENRKEYPTRARPPRLLLVVRRQVSPAGPAQLVGRMGSARLDEGLAGGFMDRKLVRAANWNQVTSARHMLVT